ncbi:MAG: hypothetical protein L7S67_05365, partial [Flavobacteriales bacterium]|nr:hypothetical protein [Flavobacteriales bacterium]
RLTTWTLFVARHKPDVRRAKPSINQGVKKQTGLELIHSIESPDLCHADQKPFIKNNSFKLIDTSWIWGIISPDGRDVK